MLYCTFVAIYYESLHDETFYVPIPSFPLLYTPQRLYERAFHRALCCLHSSLTDRLVYLTVLLPVPVLPPSRARNSLRWRHLHRQTLLQSRLSSRNHRSAPPSTVSTPSTPSSASSPRRSPYLPSSRTTNSASDVRRKAMLIVYS